MSGGGTGYRGVHRRRRRCLYGGEWVGVVVYRIYVIVRLHDNKISTWFEDKDVRITLVHKCKVRLGIDMKIHMIFIFSDRVISPPCVVTHYIVTVVYICLLYTSDAADE